MEVVHHQRFAGPDHVSIERLFEEVRGNLPPPWRSRVATCPYLSRGLMPRIRNMASARRRAGAVNHVIGDVHYLALGLPRKGLVLTIHDCAALSRLRGAAREVFRQFWFVRPMQRARIVTTISQAMREELQQGFGGLAEGIRVIPNCVRAEFVPQPKVFNSTAPVVLQIGTGWNKNVERVAEALCGTSCRLDIIGALSESQRRVIGATGIAFRELGRISDAQVLEAYRQCDIVVFASLYEGFGLPILEAQAIGRPIITSNFGAMAEAAGSGALLVDPTDVADLHRAVALLCSNEEARGQLVSDGFKNVSRFTSQKVAAQYAAIYDDVAMDGLRGGQP